MKNLFAAFCGVALTGLASCANPGASKVIEGYPVYKFLNFGAIDAKALKANEAATRKFLGQGYDDYVKIHELLVSHGFDRHTPITIHTASGGEAEVYVRKEDYDLLWKTNPHELAKRKKSHLVTIHYVQVRVAREPVNRAASFQAHLVDREPILRK